MSGAQSSNSQPYFITNSGLFQNTTVDPTETTDIQGSLTEALSAGADADASATAAAASAASAATSAATALSAAQEASTVIQNPAEISTFTVPVGYNAAQIGPLVIAGVLTIPASSTFKVI